MLDFFSLGARGFTTTVLIAGGGITPAEGAGCPGKVPATAMVTTGSLGRHSRSVCHELLYSRVLGGCSEGVVSFG
jgi:hypothetical protein